MSKRIYVRPKTFKDHTGLRQGRLTVISEAVEFTKKRMAYWNCVCDCGNKKIISSKSIYLGTKSCGCLKIEAVINRNTTHGCGSPKGENYLEYCSWSAMKARCYNENSIGFNHYGGRGIKVCDRWLNSFHVFLEDMGKRGGKEYSLERINVNGNYEPSNCRWATMKEQKRNTRRSNIISFQGESMVITDWAKFFNVSCSSITKHLKNGKRFDDIYDMYVNKERSRAWKLYHNKK